jgi:hypothetical protein
VASQESQAILERVVSQVRQVTQVWTARQVLPATLERVASQVRQVTLACQVTLVWKACQVLPVTLERVASQVTLERVVILARPDIPDTLGILVRTA